MIYLNPMIDCASDFTLLNYLFRNAWISMIPTFGLSLECLIYQVSAWSCRALTNVTLFILSSVTPCASHTTLTTNQNWSGTSFLKPLNIGNFIVLAILNRGGDGGGIGEDGVDSGEASGSVGGGGIFIFICLIRWISLQGETLASCSSSSCGDEIKGASFWSITSFVPIRFSNSRSPEHQGNYITLFSHNTILIQLFKYFTYLPPGPLRKCCAASL